MSITPRRLGKYELQELLGRGGMAEVWKAYDTQLRRYVAIKLLHPDLQADPDFISRFTREAQMVAALRHPNIVQIYDFYISEGDNKDQADSSTTAYMVMEYIKGQTLAHYINTTSHKKEFPRAAAIIRLFTPISLALDYAHRQGMIHRDIKPANILLDENNTMHNAMGEPILSDFGIARLVGAASQTATGSLMGTPLYISPEQVQNHPVSSRTDLYALGVVLYEMFVGVPPFQGDTLTGIMMKHLTEMPTPPHLANPSLPPELSEVLLKSLAKDPQDRFASASAMTVAIAEAFHLPVPQELEQVISLTDERTVLAREASSLISPLSSGSPPAARAVSEQETVKPASRSDIFGTALSEQDDASEHKNATSTGDYGPITPPPKTAGAASSPASGPDSEARLAAPSEGSIQEKQHIASPAQPPVTTPPAPSKRQGLRIALIALVTIVVVGSALGAFALFAHQNTTATTGANTVVGQALFLSSGQVNQATNQGINDEFQINLHNIPAPQSGKNYYAWLLPDKSQVEAPDILLGKLTVNNGAVHFFYAGDGQHTNLLAITSGFLVTQEDANVTPSVPSPDLANWRYFAQLPQTPAPGQKYSLLDHLRHLLTNDPDLEAYHLPGGLNIWTYRNTQTILALANSARNDWSAKHFVSLRHETIAILDYLDGQQFVQKDVPPGSLVYADPQISQVGLLEFDPIHQNPPGYLYHIALHLNGVLASPGSTQYQRTLAGQINMALNNVKGWLAQARRDAVQLAGMNSAQLSQQSTLNLLNDLVTQTNNAYQGQTNPATGQLQKGISQLFLDVQRLAAFDVTPYK